MLWLAVPRLAAALHELPGRAAVDLLESGALPNEAGLLRAIEAQTGSIALLPRAEPHMRVAYMAQTLAESSGVAHNGTDELVAVARYHLARTLSLAPGNSRGWMMLAGTRLRDGDDQGAARALAVSFAADPHAPRLAPFRWPMVLRLGDRLTREARERAHLEFLSFFRSQPETAVRIALRQGRLAELEALARQDGRDADRLDRILQRMRPDGGRI